MKSKGGRPTKVDDLVVKKLEEAFALGATDAEACFYAGISKQCLYDYEKKKPEFSDRKAALKERPILLARRSVVEGIEKDPALALKFLERKKRDEFSLRSEHEVKQPVIQITQEHAEKVMQMAELSRKYREEKSEFWDEEKGY